MADGVGNEAQHLAPKNNLEAEQALLGALLRNNEAFHHIEPILRAHEFAEPVNKRIFELAARRIEEGALASPVTLKPFLSEDEMLKNVGTQYVSWLATRAGITRPFATAAQKDSAAARLPKRPRAREELAHSILIFFVKPDDAEVLLGDLLEEFEKVRPRKSDRLARRWFWWQVALIVLHQLDAKLGESKLLGKFLRRG